MLQFGGTRGRYVVALLLTAAAFVVRFALDPWMGGASPLMTFTLAVMASAIGGGLGPGLFATTLSAILGTYFLGRDGVDGFEGEALQLIVFVGIGIGVSLLGERFLRARRLAEDGFVQIKQDQERIAREVADRKKAHAELQSQKDLLQTTLSSAGDGMIATDAEGRVTFLNPIAQELTGWSQEEAEGTPLTTIFRIVNEQTRAKVDNPALRALHEGRIVGLANHTILIAKDGTERPIDDSAAPIRNPDGMTCGAVLVFRDITERKQAEVALAERNRLIALRADIGTAFANSGITESALQQCCESLVKHLDAALVRIWIVDPKANELEPKATAGDCPPLHGPHGRIKIGEYKIGRIAANKQPHLTNDIVGDPNVSDPEWAKREGLVAFSGFPLLVEGRVVGVLGIFARRSLSDDVLTDLAPLAEHIAQFVDRRQFVERLHESEERTRSVLESISDGFFAINRDWRFSYLNCEAQRLLDRQDLLGKDLREEYPEGIATEFQKAYTKAMTENVPVTFEAFFAPQDCWYDVHAYPSPDGLAIYFRDVTARRRSEKQQRELMAVVETSTDLIGIAGLDGHIRFFNAAGRRMLGLANPEEAQASSLFDFIVPEDMAFAQQTMLPQLNEVGSWEGEWRYRRKDGSVFPVSKKVSVIRDAESGQPAAYATVSRDITDRKAAEEALRQSEERLRAIVDATPECVKIVANDGRLVHMNAAGLEMIEADRLESVAGACVYDLIAPEHRQAWVDFNARICNGASERFEFDVLGLKGTRRHMETHAVPIRMPDGTSAHLAVTRDISERKRAEEALQQSEQRFRTLAEAVPQIVWVARPDGWHEFFNARWYEYTGMSPDESIGAGWSLPLHPEDRSRSEARWKQATDSGEPYEIEYRFRGRDGIYRWFLARAVPVRDDSGVITRWFGTCTDIDGAKRSEQKAAFLADASSHLAELLDYRSTMQKVAQSAVPAFSDWIMVDLVGEDGNLHRVATTHTDRSKERLANELAEKFPPVPDDPQGPSRVFRTGDPELVPEVTEEVMAALAKTDEHRHLLENLGFRSYMSVPLVAKGRATGVMTFVAGPERRYDMSDLQVAEDLGRRVAVAVENVGLYEALKEADQRKDEFLATLAHELRNPLAPIRMGLEVLRLGGDDPATIAEMLDTMEGQVRQMVRLIDDLLDVSRITRGKLDLRRTQVDLRDVAKSAIETVRPLTDEARHELSVSLPQEPLILDGDPARLSQILSNLLNNAVKYTPEEGFIALTAERQGSDVVVSVKDTGLGIPPEMLEKVFEMFAQVDRTLERSHGGLGIGLHLVKRLVEMHGGTVQARSEGEGRGSEFIVRLPLVLNQVDSAPRLIDGQSRGTGRRVLVADDNRDAADMLTRVLNALGHEVQKVYDGEQAIAAAESFRPEVCLLDIGMPKKNGYDVARFLREQPWGRSMVLIALTGWGAEEDRRRSRDAGFDRHLVKPVEPSELREILAKPHRAMT